MSLNHVINRRNALSGRLLICYFGSAVASHVIGKYATWDCPLQSENDIFDTNASSLLQVHKPQETVKSVAEGNTLVEEASGKDAKLDSRLREQLDASVLEDAKLRRANKNLERKLVEEHDEVQRLKVMVESLYKDKMRKPVKQEPAHAHGEEKMPTRDDQRDHRKDDDDDSEGEAPCQCEVENAEWKRPAPRQPRCIFVDLGAADGNTFHRFLSHGYGDVRNCPSHGAYEAILVEANPVFNRPLQLLEKNYSGLVKSVISTAAYMCEGKTSFYLDTVDVQHNFWGSSMSPNARDVQRSGKRKVTVPLVNLNRLLWETAIKEDYVLVKMDIEGSEHDILPCLSKSRAAELVDALYVEQHPVEWSRAGAQKGSLERALTIFQERGVTTPVYDTPM